MLPFIGHAVAICCFALFTSSISTLHNNHLLQIRSSWASHSFRKPLKLSAVTISVDNEQRALWSARVQRLKDTSLQKDILRHLTAAEFALKVEGEKDDIIDFDRLIDKLDNDMIRLSKWDPPLPEKEGLLTRIETMRQELALAAQRQPKGAESPSAPSAKEKPGLGSNTNAKVKELTDSLRIMIREDGSVDWDGAIASGREVARFGADLWERLNGKEKEEGLPSIQEVFSQMQAPSPKSPTIDKLTEIVQAAEESVRKAVQLRENLQLKLRKDRRSGKGISREEVQTLRRVDQRVKELDKRLKLFIVDLNMEKICTYLQQELEESGLDQAFEQRSVLAEVTLIDKQLRSLLSGTSFQLGTAMFYDSILPIDQSYPFGYDAGGIATSTSTGTSNNAIMDGIKGETMGSAVADAVLAAGDAIPELAGTASTGIAATEASIPTAVIGAADDKMIDIIALIDREELNLIYSEVNDLKNRLGLDNQLIPEVDWGSVGKFAGETLNKIKVGLTYFGEGSGLLLSDVQYGWTMMLKAAQGYTLKPREVNAVRRTGKDILTLIPFTIILLIPLSPVGHVLVFAFIQKYFPEFYPSCYTDKRLNLKRLFAEVERTYNDDLLLGKESTTESIQGAFLSLTRPLQSTFEQIMSANDALEEFLRKFFPAYELSDSSKASSKDDASDK